jgi:hypothetical protein
MMNLQQAGFIPVDAVIPGYSANQAAIARSVASAAQTATEKKREAIGAQIDTGAAEELSRRNETTAMRQNQNAMLNREGTRAGGGRYRRRGLFTPGGSGLDKANSAALVEARKKAAYANFDAGEAARVDAESKAAMNAYNNRLIGFKNGALYI